MQQYASKTIQHSLRYRPQGAFRASRSPALLQRHTPTPVHLVIAEDNFGQTIMPGMAAGMVRTHRFGPWYHQPWIEANTREPSEAAVPESMQCPSESKALAEMRGTYWTAPTVCA